MPWLDFMESNAYERELATKRYFQQQRDGSIPDFPIGDQSDLDAFLQSVLGPEAAKIWQLNTAEGDFELSEEERPHTWNIRRRFRALGRSPTSGRCARFSAFKRRLTPRLTARTSRLGGRVFHNAVHTSPPARADTCDEINRADF